MLEIPVLLANANIPWPNTDSKIVLVCREIKPKDTYGANEFVKDGKICRWTLETIKPKTAP